MKEKGIINELRQSEWLTEGVKKQFRAWIGLKWKESNQDNQDKQVVSFLLIDKKSTEKRCLS